MLILSSVNETIIYPYIMPKDYTWGFLNWLQSS